MVTCDIYYSCSGSNLAPKCQLQSWEVLCQCVGFHPIEYLLKWTKLGLNTCLISMRRGLFHETNSMIALDIGVYRPCPNLAPKCQLKPWGFPWHCVDLLSIGYLLEWAKLGLNIFATGMRRDLFHQRNNMVMGDICFYHP